MNEALDQLAPIRTFKIKEKYVHGLTEETKNVMKDRDRARKEINKSTTAMDRNIKLAQL